MSRAGALARVRVTGTVVVDVSAYVDESGWLTRDGVLALWSGLAAARELPARIELGAMRYAPLTVIAALEAAAGCASVEVCGTEPEGVATIIRTLRGGPPPMPGGAA